MVQGWEKGEYGMLQDPTVSSPYWGRGEANRIKYRFARFIRSISLASLFAYKTLAALLSSFGGQSVTPLVYVEASQMLEQFLGEPVG